MVNCFRIHVRRTDKVGTEAAFHGIEEYMQAVDDYYDQVEMVEAIDKRRVFIASDDPKVSSMVRFFPGILESRYGSVVTFLLGQGL